MGQRIFQPSFAGGIIGPSMYSRSDTTKYTVGVRAADNVVVRLQGGLANRPGFELAAGFDTSDGGFSQWLLPVQISSTLGYLLEFSDGVFRVISQGSYVLDSNVAEAGVAAIAAADPAEITCASPGEAAVFSVGDLVYLRDDDGDHVLGDQIFEVTAVSGDTVSVVDYSGETIDTTTGDWGTLGAGAALARVYQRPHPYPLADIPFIRFAQDNADVYIVHPEHRVRKITVNAADDWDVEDVVSQPGTPAPAEPSALSYSITGATQANPVVLTLGAHDIPDGSTIYVSGVVGMTELNNRFFQTANATATTVELRSVSGAPENGTGHTAYASGGTAQCYVAIEETAESGSVERYQIAAIDGESLEESLPTRSIQVDTDLELTDVTLIWTAVEGATVYNIYKEATGGFGLIGTTAATSFVDKNFTPDATIGPQILRRPFDEGNHPSVISFVEQRLALANTVEDPQIVEMSQTNSFTNFQRSYPQRASDSLTFRLRTRQLNDVRALVPGSALVMFTAAAEWLVTGSENEGVLTPTSIVPRPVSYWGSFDIEPVTVGEFAFFVEPSGNVIRDFQLSFARAAVAEASRDVTILVRHLFENREVTSWTYTQAPDRILWVTLDDGSLLSLTYMSEHDIWGWTTHTLGGEGTHVYQAASVREGSRDVLYVVVGRTLQGKHVVMTERLADRVDEVIEDAFFVDSGLTYRGAATGAVSGLFHLRGETVVGLVDGSVYEDLVVDDRGVVDFGGVEGEVIHVGHPYTATIETLDVDFEADGLGSMQGRYKATSEVAISVQRSRGMRVGTDLDRMNELIEWTPEYTGEPIPSFTGTHVIGVEGDWVRNARVIVQQVYPLPLTVTGIAPEWTIGE